MDLHYICTAQTCWKHIFAPEQTCSKRGKVHICYHIYTNVQIYEIVVIQFQTFHGRWKSDSSKDMYVEESLENRLQVTKYLCL